MSVRDSTFQHSDSAEPATRQFLIEYYGEGEQTFNDVDCWSEVDADNMAWCDAEFFSCKCQDSRNNTYTCLRTIFGEEEDTILCLFEVCITIQGECGGLRPGLG